VKTQLLEIKQERDRLLKDIEKLKADLNHSYESKNKVEKDLIEKLNKVIIDYENKMKNSKEETNKAYQVVQDKETIIKTMNGNLDYLSLDTYEAKFKELFNMNSTATGENEDLAKKLKLKEDECQKLLEEKKGIIDEIGSGSEGLNEYLKKEKEKLDIEVVELRAKVEDLSSKLTKSLAELEEKSKAQNNHIGKKFDELGLCKLDDIHAELKKSKQREEQLSSNIQELMTEMSSQEQIRHKKELVYSDLKTNFDQLTVEKNELEVSNKHMNTRVGELSRQIEACQETIKKNNSYIKELEDIKKNVQKTNEQSNLVIEENHLLKKEIELFKKKVHEEQERLKEAKDEITAKVGEILNLNDDISQRDTTITELEEKVAAIETEFEEIKLKNTIFYVCSSVDNFALTKDIIIDHIYTLYLFDNAINFQDVIQYLLNNFNILLNTIFLRRDNCFSSYTLIHEFLEDLYFKIFDTCITYKVNKIKETKDSNVGREFWLLNQDDFKAEIIKQISQEFFDTNVLSLTNNIIKPQKTVDDIIEMFVKTYEGKYDLGKIKLGEYMEKEVRHKVIEKIDKNKQNILNELKTLIEFSITNIHDAKICYNNKEIYNFKEFFVENISKVIKNKSSLEINHNLGLPEAMDSLVYTLKYQSKDLRSLYLNSNYDGNTEFPLARTVLTILFYSPFISKLTLTESILDEKQISNLAKYLEFSKSLQHLDLSNNNITDEGVRLICEYLKANKTITSLNLNRNNLNQNSGFYIADMLMKNNCLEELYLSKNLINDAGISSLMTVLINYNKNIKVLDISHNELKLDDYEQIANLLAMNISLTNLNLSGNQIDSKNANKLGYALKTATKLTILNLTDTGINEESFALLVKNLNESKLTEIYLDYNNIGEVVVLLGNILRNNNCLKLLSLKKCKMNSMSLICLCKALEVNDKLEVIRLEDNVFDESALTLLDKTVRDKQFTVYLGSIGLPSRYKDIFKGTKNIIII
jgi:Ran GTPase-activating protein (RanGAP) involved in mRNA processing and transport